MNRIIRFIKHVIGLLKRGYLYYYYLCFKDFIKKLLKPKKMIPIKWRINQNDTFKFVTQVEDSMIFKSSNLMDCFNTADKFKFRVRTPNTETTIEPQSYFYLINPNTLYWFNDSRMKWEVFCGEILGYEYKSDWVGFNFKRLSEKSNTYFFFNARENSIVKIDGSFCDFMKEVEMNLKEEGLDRFVDFFRIGGV